MRQDFMDDIALSFAAESGRLPRAYRTNVRSVEKSAKNPAFKSKRGGGGSYSHQVCLPFRQHPRSRRRPESPAGLVREQRSRSNSCLLIRYDGGTARRTLRTLAAIPGYRTLRRWMPRGLRRRRRVTSCSFFSAHSAMRTWLLVASSAMRFAPSSGRSPARGSGRSCM